MIVGGFPCQDYSVARSKKNEKGIEGKKGVLFWDIIRAIENIKPKYLILENVDRLLKAPSKQRGRDFAIMLTAFNNLGYSVDKYRLITPIEAERLQDFPDNWTSKKKLADGSIVEVSDKMRMFFMGNALVTEIVKEIANFIRKIEK